MLPLKHFRMRISHFVLCGMLVTVLINYTTLQLYSQHNHRYPRRGVFHWGGAPIEWYAKFDLVITINTISSFASSIKALNPDSYVLPTTDWNAGASIDPIPNQWFVRNSQGDICKIYAIDVNLVDITDYCPTSSAFGQSMRYNEYLPVHMENYVDYNYYDGISTDGVYDIPRGDALVDVDLDRNGVNDWDEHGKTWIRDTWLAGLHKATVDLRNRIGNNKIIFFNSGRFHDFEWDVTNGLYLEHAECVSSFKSIKENYDGFMAAAPQPHVLHYGANMGLSRSDFPYIRCYLGICLYGDGYFEGADKTAMHHYYTLDYDEYYVDLGYPTEPMRKILDTGQNEKGIWLRFFDNGAVIVNIDRVPHTVTAADISSWPGYDGPYYRFQGGQDPNFNNGQLFDQVALNGRDLGICYIGDGIILVKNPTTSIADIIVDNNHVGTSVSCQSAELIGSWNETNDKTRDCWTMGGRGSRGIYDIAITSSGSGEDEAVYTPMIGLAGDYEVFEWHGYQIGLNAASNVPFQITYDKAATASGVIDQSANQGQWNRIGTFYFDKGTGGNIIITNKANNSVIADAFKFVYLDSQVDNVNPNSPSGLKTDDITEHTILLSWTPPTQASDGDVAAAYQVFRDNVLIGTPISTAYLDSNLAENTTYDYAVYSVDKAGNRSSGAATGTFSTNFDNIRPTIKSVIPINLTSVKVIFSEGVDQISSENTGNYTILDNATVFSATQLSSPSTVKLTTSDHEIGVQYSLIVNNIMDLAKVPNTILPNSSFNYSGLLGDTLVVTLSVDNACDVYINGDFIANDSNWGTARIYKVPAVGGKNVIAVKGTDLGAEGGLVGEIDYQGTHYVSDESWKVSTVLEDDWEMINYNDVSWQKATSYGLHGVALPWSQYHDVTGISTDSGVHWIWSSDYMNDDEVYFRFSINATGDIIPPDAPTGVSVSQP